MKEDLYIHHESSLQSPESRSTHAVPNEEFNASHIHWYKEESVLCKSTETYMRQTILSLLHLKPGANVRTRISKTSHRHRTFAVAWACMSIHAHAWPHDLTVQLMLLPCVHVDCRASAVWLPCMCVPVADMSSLYFNMFNIHVYTSDNPKFNSRMIKYFVLPLFYWLFLFFALGRGLGWVCAAGNGVGALKWM